MDATWRCPTCGRPFRRRGQRHSCRVVSVEEHLGSRPEARVLLERLVTAVTDAIGPCEVVALPCCLHLAVGADLLAVLPKRDRLELRFTLPERLDHPRVLRAERTGAAAVKHRVDVATLAEIDEELLTWLRAAHAAGR